MDLDLRGLEGVSFHQPKPTWGRVLVIVGSLLISLAAMIVAAEIPEHVPELSFLEGSWIELEVGRGDTAPHVWVTSFGTVGGFGVWVLLRGRRLLAQSAADVLDADGRPFILYLRGFGDDALAPGARSTSSIFGEWNHERTLLPVLERVGPVIAVGRPGERLPELGGGRLYIRDDRWRAVVTTLLANCAAAVVQVGSTEGIRWEAREARRVVHPERLLYVLPVFDRSAWREECARRYRALRGLLRDQVRFPSSGKGAQLIGFRYDGTPWLLPKVPPRLGSDKDPPADLRRSIIPFIARWSLPGGTPQAPRRLVAQVGQLMWGLALAHPGAGRAVLFVANLSVYALVWVLFALTAALNDGLKFVVASVIVVSAGLWWRYAAFAWDELALWTTGQMLPKLPPGLKRRSRALR